MIWIQHAPAAVIAFLVVLLAMLPLASLGEKLGWVYENARATRRVVMQPVPYVGGLAVLLGLLCAALFSSWPGNTLGLGLGMLMVFILGFVGDNAPMRERFWYAGMFAAAAAAVIGGQHMITSTGPLFGPFEIPLSIFSLPVTVAIVGVIALGFRTIDRADGLCDGQALISTLALSTVAILIGVQGASAWPLPGVAAVSLSLIGALIGLGWYTLRRPGRRLAAVYLGSAGAMMLGLIVGWLGVQVHAGFGDAGMGLGGLLWLVAIPLTDLLFYGLRRLMTGHRWQEDDKFRIYHWLKEQQFTVDQAVMITHGAAVAAAVLSILAWQIGLPDFLMFWGFWVAFGAYALVALAFWNTTHAEQQMTVSNWHTAGAGYSEENSVTIDMEAHTVLGQLGEDTSDNPYEAKPLPRSGRSS